MFKNKLALGASLIALGTIATPVWAATAAACRAASLAATSAWYSYCASHRAAAAYSPSA